MKLFFSFLFFAFASIPPAAFSEDVTRESLGNGVLKYVIPATALKIDTTIDHGLVIRNNQIFFPRSLYDFPVCVASHDKLFRVPKSGTLTIIPEFSVSWFGSYNPLKTNRLYTAAFVLMPGSRESFLWITTDHYKKEGLSNNQDGSVSFMGEFEQSPLRHLIDKGQQPLQLTSSVNAGDEISICLAYLTRGTELTLDSLHVRYVPDVHLTQAEQIEKRETEKKLKETQLDEANLTILSLTTALNFQTAFRIMQEACNALYHELSSESLRELLARIKSISSIIPKIITDYEQSLSMTHIETLVRVKTLADSVDDGSFWIEADDRNKKLDDFFSDEDKAILKEIADDFVKDEGALRSHLEKTLARKIHLEGEIGALIQLLAQNQ